MLLAPLCANASLNKMGTGAVRTVNCIVSDPGKLKDEVGFKENHQMQIDSLHDGFITLYQNSSPVITELKGSLMLEKTKFSVTARDTSEYPSSAEVRMKGSFVGRGRGSLTLKLIDSEGTFEGTALLKDCIWSQ